MVYQTDERGNFRRDGQGQMVKVKAADNFVPAGQGDRRRLDSAALAGEIVNRDAAPLSGLMSGASGALQSRDAVRETTGPMVRAKSLVVRQLWPSALILVGSGVFVWATGVSAPWTFGLWFMGSLAYYLWTDGREWAHSEGGIERQKVDAVENILLTLIDREYDDRADRRRVLLSLGDRDDG